MLYANHLKEEIDKIGVIKINIDKGNPIFIPFNQSQQWLLDITMNESVDSYFDGENFKELFTLIVFWLYIMRFHTKIVLTKLSKDDFFYLDITPNHT